MSAQPLWQVPPDDSDWLKRIAIEVDEFVQHPAVMAKFRRILRKWLAVHEVANSKNGVIQIPPGRAMSLPEKYAVLAAIHDKLCSSDAQKINPWRVEHEGGWSEGQKAQFSSGISYAVLQSRVKEIKETDRERLFRALLDVRSDLERLRLVQTDDRANSTQLHKPTPDDFPARILRNFFARSGEPRPTGSRHPDRQQEPEKKANQSEQAAISIDEAIQSLTDRDRGVFQTIYDFEHKPYPTEPEQLEGCDEMYAPQPKSITPVPWYFLKGAHWPVDPSPSLLALTRFGLIRQPNGVYHRSVHCRLPSGRVLRVEYKLKRLEAAGDGNPSHFVVVYVDGRDEFCEDSATWVAKPNAYELTPLGLRVARRMLVNDGIGTQGRGVLPFRNANADKEFMSIKKAMVDFPIPGVTTDKQRVKFLSEHPEIRTKKPSKQRLLVHIADWINAKNAEEARTAADPTPAEIASRGRAIREQRGRYGK